MPDMSRRVFIILLALATAPAATARADGIDLDECFLMAVRHSEALQMKDEVINQAAAKFKQALGAALPQVTFKASEMIQHTLHSA